MQEGEGSHVITQIAPALAQGSSCVLSYTLKNVGTATVSSTLTEITLTPTSGGTTHTLKNSEISLQVGQVLVETVTLSFDCSSGTYTETVTANSDPNDRVQESSYANNSMSMPEPPLRP